jgi:hypothetical protein
MRIAGGFVVIDSVLNLVFRCAHRRLTRPITPVVELGAPRGETYVVCLDCGKQFSYDLKEMKMGKPVASSANSGVLDPETAKPRGKKLKYAILASLPLAALIGSSLRTKKQD